MCFKNNDDKQSNFTVRIMISRFYHWHVMGSSFYFFTRNTPCEIHAVNFKIHPWQTSHFITVRNKVINGTISQWNHRNFSKDFPVYTPFPHLEKSLHRIFLYSPLFLGREVNSPVFVSICKRYIGGFLDFPNFCHTELPTNWDVHFARDKILKWNPKS